MAMTKRRWMTPEEFGDEDLGSLTPRMRFFALAFRMWADDEGRASANPRSIHGAIFANDETTSPEDVTNALLVLEDMGYLVTYRDPTRNRDLYAIAPRFHTLPDKPRPSEFAAPPVPTASRHRRDGVPVVGREGEEEREGQSEERARGAEREPRSRRHPDALPPMFCPEHMPSGSGGVPCGPCRDARMVHEAAARARIPEPLADDEEDA